MVVGKRIQAVKSLVPHGTRLLDIGSDHALLPISLYLDGVINAAVITDVNKGPLERSRLQVAALCPELPCCYLLSDGFAMVDGGYDVAAICGMGGELIARIVEEAGDKAHCPLILQPMTMGEKLREYLWTHGFEIQKELFVTDEGKPYVVIYTEYTGNNTEYDLVDMYFGKERPDTEDFRNYAAKIAAAAARRLIGIQHRGEDPPPTQALVSFFDSYSQND